MTTYLINIENTGLDSDEQVQKMAEMMQSDGYDVEFTSNFGLVNRVECPVSESDWFDYVVRAAE